MKFNSLSLLVGASLFASAIALPAFSNPQVFASTNLEPLYLCETDELEMDDLAGLALNDSQQARIESLDAQLSPDYDALEAQIYALEAQLEPQFQSLDEQYEAELASILMPQQLEQLRLNILTTDFPELDGITLTSKQIETLWQTSKALDADIHQLMNTLFNQMPEASEQEWDAAFESLEAIYEQTLQEILTAEQYQQFQQNLAAIDAACEA
ncbi:MAG: hypothetical protein AAGD25_19220 [Cyanobacteria bacterium P01_F01_bin.150]